MPSRKRRRESSRKDISTDSLLAYLRTQPQRTSGFGHILDHFDADTTDRRQIRDILDQLVRDGQLARHKGHRYEAQPATTTHVGRVHLHADGYAFVTPANPLQGIEGDVFIPPRSTATAMDGDEVSFVVVSPHNAEGRIVEITRRAHNRAVGQLRFDGRAWFLSPADARLPDRILVTGDVSEHKDKLVEIELSRYPSESQSASGTIVAVIGFMDDPNVETNLIMKKYGLDPAFSTEVEQEVESCSLTLSAEDFKGRTDFRDRKTITIDPATARDFDDAIDVTELPNGSFQVGIHIADVAHFVTRGSAVDIEARERGCSVYFPDRVVPMLPEILSNDICSLNANTDRLATSVVLDIDPKGRVTGSRFHQSVIRSRERMNYGAVQEILDNDTAARSQYHAVVPEIETLGHVAGLLQTRRRERGTIDFDLPEPELTYDEQGVVAGISKSERYFAHRLVEEFMIAANEAVADLLETHLPACIFRIHEPPDPDRVGELSETLAGMGLNFHPPDTHPKAFQKFLTSIEGRPDAQMISFLVLRSFRQAVYSTENRGHFGLASQTYTHFTSPIRRYPDLVVHRMLKAWLDGRRTGYTPGDLESVSKESSARERIADQAERDLFQWKRMNLLEERLGETLDAIIIHVFPKGMRVELVDDFIEGYIRVDDMTDDYYGYNARARALVGRHTRRRYQLGQRIPVQVARIDKLLGRAYFVLA